jgi:class 3 adenylate cyclase/tetratricopeptide (TPR) repeat protein
MSDCSACGSANPDGARFCGHCGAAIPQNVTCASCGGSNPGENAYCNACGQALARSEPVAHGRRPDGRARIPERVAAGIRATRGQLEGERKQVTVLFADVVGSTKLAERTGVERWQQLIERFFTIVSEAVHGYEGIIDRFTGDGAMAVFGAPLADEQHALHACHAALELSGQLAAFSAELRREQGLNLLVRIGLNSGEVVVGTIGEDLDVKYTAVGHTVALAKRMEGLAEPGKVYLTESTAQDVQGYFELRDLGVFDVKGVEDPVRVYELAGLGRLRTALELARVHGLSRFVGRDEELRALESALARVRAGNGQVACVAGEAGVGKSRLLYEFANRCREQDVEVWEGHCRARGETLALMPLLELLRSSFGIGERDAGAAAREKIAGRVLQLDHSLDDQLPLLFELLGVADPEVRAERIDPEARQRRLSAMLNRIVAVSSERSGMVLVLEDLQWIDPGSAAFLANLIDALPGTHTLVLTSFRPPYRADWMRRSYCGRAALAPLAATSSRELLDYLLGDDPSVADVCERIEQRAGGNPFFIEELVRGLVDLGRLAGDRGAYRLVRRVDEQALPATVQAVIAARIDRLPEREKRLLQTAAVIGRQFTQSLLSGVAGTSAPETGLLLRALLAAELVYERAHVPEPEYVFGHQLIAEVAYRSQLAKPRARLHAQAAAVLQELYADRLDELAGVISHHFEQAGDPLAAARWGARAGLWAGFADPAGALGQWRRVSDLADRAPDSPEAASIAIWSRIATMHFGSMVGTDADEIAAVFEQARSVAQQSGDVRSLAMVLGMYAHTQTMAGDAAASIDMHLEALRLAGQSGDPALQVSMIGVPLALMMTGRWHEALEIMTPWFRLWANDPTLAPRLPGLSQSPNALGISLRAEIRLLLGELTIPQAYDEIRRALALALEHGDFESACVAYTMQVTICYWAADGDSALDAAKRGVQLAERTGSFSALAHAYSSRGLAHRIRREWEQAITAEQRSLQIVHQTPADSAWEPLSLAQLADAYLGAGHPERARDTATRAISIAAKGGNAFFELVAQLALERALIALQPQCPDGQIDPAAKAQIEAVLARIESLIDQLDARGYEAFRHEARARLAQLLGDTTTYTREVSQAQQRWKALGADRRAALPPGTPTADLPLPK